VLGAPSIRPMRPARGRDRAALRRSSASFESKTRRGDGDEAEAREAVFMRRGRWEFRIEGRSEPGTNTAAISFGLSGSGGFAMGFSTLLEGSFWLCVFIEAYRCAKPSRYFVIELKPVVIYCWMPGVSGISLQEASFSGFTDRTLSFLLRFLSLLPLEGTI